MSDAFDIAHELIEEVLGKASTIKVTSAPMKPTGAGTIRTEDTPSSGVYTPPVAAVAAAAPAPYYGPSVDPRSGEYSPPASASMPPLLDPYARYAPQYAPPAPVVASGFTGTHALIAVGALGAIGLIAFLARRK